MLGAIEIVGTAIYMWGYHRYTYTHPLQPKYVICRSAWKHESLTLTGANGEFDFNLKPIINPTSLHRRLIPPAIAAVVVFAAHVGLNYVPPYRDWDTAWDKYGFEAATKALHLPNPPQNTGDLKKLVGIAPK